MSTVLKHTRMVITIAHIYPFMLMQTKDVRTRQLKEHMWEQDNGKNICNTTYVIQSLKTFYVKRKHMLLSANICQLVKEWKTDRQRDRDRQT